VPGAAQGQQAVLEWYLPLLVQLQELVRL